MSLTSLVKIRKLFDVVPYYTCLSCDNEYIPAVSIADSETITKEDGTSTVLYTIGYSHSSITITNRVANFCSKLFGHEINAYLLKKDDFGDGYHVWGSYLYHLTKDLVLTPLLVVCVKSSKCLTIDRENPNLDDCTILVNIDLVTNEEHHKIYRNIKRDYLNVVSLELNVLYTSKIKKLAFNQIRVPEPSFNSITEMREHFEGINNLLATI